MHCTQRPRSRLRALLGGLLLPALCSGGVLAAAPPPTPSPADPFLRTVPGVQPPSLGPAGQQGGSPGPAASLPPVSLPAVSIPPLIPPSSAVPTRAVAPVTFGVPRVSNQGSSTRVVLDLAPGQRYTLTPTYGGLRLDAFGVAARPLRLSRPGSAVSDYLLNPVPNGAQVVLSTPFSLGLSDGWTASEATIATGGRVLILNLGASVSGGADSTVRGAVQLVASPAAAPTVTVTTTAVSRPPPPSVTAAPRPASPAPVSAPVPADQLPPGDTAAPLTGSALPASTPALAGSADRTRLTAGTVAGVAQPGQELGAPRIGKNPGLTRLVLDLPPGSSFRLTPLPLGLRVDITGVSVPLGSAALGVSPELLSWSYSPALAGVSVTLNTPTPISLRSGWRDVLLPPVEGSSLSRLAIDLSPALADTTPLGALALAPLPLRVGGPLAFSGNPNAPTVVLDPGHGGPDPGAIGVVVEKAVTLDVALRVRAYLEAAGVRVIMTRDRDVALNPDKSTDLSLRAALGTGRARLFVSIHANSTEASSALRGYGVETWYNRNDPDSPALAALIQRDVTLVTAANSRGTKDFRSLAVLRESRIPAALVEIGYTSHPVDGQNLHDTNYLQRVAYGVAQGIRDALAGGIGGGKAARGW